MNKKVIVITGSSCAGKTTLGHLIIDKSPILEKAKSATTRKKRSQDDDKDYCFFDVDHFKNMILTESLLEWEEVYENNYYGTQKLEIERIWNSHKIPVLVLDVKGAVKIKELFGSNCLSIFLKSKSIEDIKERLLKRGTDDNIENRLKRVEFESQFESVFDYSVINDDINRSYSDVNKIIDQFIASITTSNTLVVNLFGGPGTGKSMTAAGLFHKLKAADVEAELATEYAKDKVWEGSLEALKNQVSVFGEQHKRIFRLLDKVDVVITDSPLLLGICYSNNRMLDELSHYEHNKLNSYNVFLNRTREYKTKGRMQNESEADLKAKEMLKMLDERIPGCYEIINSDDKTVEYLFEKVMEKLKNNAI